MVSFWGVVLCQKVWSCISVTSDEDWNVNGQNKNMMDEQEWFTFLKSTREISIKSGWMQTSFIWWSEILTSGPVEETSIAVDGWKWAVRPVSSRPDHSLHTRARQETPVCLHWLFPAEQWVCVTLYPGSGWCCALTNKPRLSRKEQRSRSSPLQTCESGAPGCKAGQVTPLQRCNRRPLCPPPRPAPPLGSNPPSLPSKSSCALGLVCWRSGRFNAGSQFAGAGADGDG